MSRKDRELHKAEFEKKKYLLNKKPRRLFMFSTVTAKNNGFLNHSSMMTPRFIRKATKALWSYLNGGL